MLPHHTKFTKYFFALFVLVVLVYAYFKAQSFLFGPSVIIDATDNTITVQDELIDISGATENVVDITLSGRPIIIDDTGAFTERVLLAPGMNTFVFEARDRFDRHTRETLYILYETDGTSPTAVPEVPHTAPITATSTPEQ